MLSESQERRLKMAHELLMRAVAEKLTGEVTFQFNEGGFTAAKMTSKIF